MREFQSFDTSSRITEPGSFAFTTLDASNTPSVPRSTAIFTHSPDWIPAPVSTFTFGFTACTAATDFLIISGFALETEIPLPMSSGGSMATYSGPSAAAPALVDFVIRTDHRD